MMAALSANAPRLSWAGFHPNPHAYTPTNSLQMFSHVSLLMRFPLDRIPADQRITRAELSIQPTYIAGKPAVHVRRLLAEWGTGVCHQYRSVHPMRVEWATPGARGAGTDRAARDTGVFQMDKVGAYVIDVTADIDLWHTGAAVNRGWLLCMDEPGGVAYFASPYCPTSHGGRSWKLQITFEPR
jgi:hypothetical protein